MGVKAIQRVKRKRKETGEIDKESIWVQSCFGDMIGLEWVLEVELLLPVLQLLGPCDYGWSWRDKGDGKKGMGHEGFL